MAREKEKNKEEEKERERRGRIGEKQWCERDRQNTGGLEGRKNLTQRERVGDGESVRGREGKTKREREGKI